MINRKTLESQAYETLAEAYSIAGASDSYASENADYIITLHEMGQDREDAALYIAKHINCDFPDETKRLIYRAITMLDLAWSIR